MVNLFSFLGGSTFVTAGQALLEQELVKHLKQREHRPNVAVAHLIDKIRIGLYQKERRAEEYI